LRHSPVAWAARACFVAWRPSPLQRRAMAKKKTSMAL